MTRIDAEHVQQVFELPIRMMKSRRARRGSDGGRGMVSCRSSSSIPTAQAQWHTRRWPLPG